MSNEGKKSGGCLCGSVRFHVDEPIKTFGACHCSMCRRWGSGPFIEADCGPNVQFEGEDNIVRFQSSDWAERGFCKHCGSNLFYHLKPDGTYMMALGAFDDQSGLEMSHQVFIDEKPDGYAFANDTPTMTGAEVFAMYAPKEGDA